MLLVLSQAALRRTLRPAAWLWHFKWHLNNSHDCSAF
jgi:hypothetical protein